MTTCSQISKFKRITIFVKSFIGMIFHHKTIIKNTWHLSLISVMNLVMPFIALPYIIAKIGTEGYGLYVFFYTISNYFLMFIQFGIDSAAVKEVSIRRDDITFLSHLVSTIFGTKIILTTISWIVVIACACFIPFWRENLKLISYTTLYASAYTFTTGWFFQGKERMAYLTGLRGITISLYTISIFIFIKDESDYTTLALLQAICQWITACFAIYLVVKIGGIRFYVPKIMKIWNCIKICYPLFIANISLTINGTISKLFCMMFSVEAVGVFDLAEKIAVTAITPVRMLDTAAYPYIAKTKSASFIHKLLVVNLFIAGMMAVSIFLSAPFLIWVFAGDAMPQAISILKILSLLTLFGCLSTYMGVPLLVSFGHNHSLNFSVLMSFVAMLIFFCIAFSFKLTNIYSFAIILVLTELVLVLSRIGFCIKYNILFSRENNRPL